MVESVEQEQARRAARAKRRQKRLMEWLAQDKVRDRDEAERADHEYYDEQDRALAASIARFFGCEGYDPDLDDPNRARDVDPGDRHDVRPNLGWPA